ncbi:MAG: Fic family protein [Mycoplasmataceae bacterium]|jgi:cell filamentation protein|nr:Fic family protein [Mycoplasmataceae bacterium]
MSYNGTTNSYDLKYLCHIHKYLFSDIFDWAGELRKVDISKGSTKFANFQYIESSWNDYVSNKIKNLNNSNDKIYTLAEILSEINIIHPFREGNGRVVRIFITQLAKTVGINLNWNLVTEEENLNASILSIANPEPMARLLKKCII